MPVKTIRNQAHSVSSRVTIIDHSGSEKRSELAEKVLSAVNRTVRLGSK